MPTRYRPGTSLPPVDVGEETIKRLEAAGRRLTALHPWEATTRAALLRRCFFVGLEALEREIGEAESKRGVTPHKGPPKRPRASDRQP
jgi:hypothetical protein